MRTHFSTLGFAIAMIVGIASISTAAKEAGTNKAEIATNLQAHRSDFDYLLGDWAFTARSARWGAYRGLWSAVRLPGGQILDEFRPMAEDGSDYGATTTVRAYDPVLDRWDLVSLSERGGLQDLGHARAANGEVLIDQRLGAPEPSLWHIRYHDIGADHFLWNGDRSRDGGRTWQRDYLVIDARRIGAPRPDHRLTPPSLPAIDSSAVDAR